MDALVYRYTVDPQKNFDWLLWNSGLTINFPPDALRLAERFGLQRARRSTVVELEAILRAPDQRLVAGDRQLRVARLDELVAFAHAFPDAHWNNTLMALESGFYYGHRVGFPGLDRSEQGCNLCINWIYPFGEPTRLYVRTV